MGENASHFTFDPVLVAFYETQWWIAHNENDKENLVKNLISQHMEMFGLSENKAKTAISFFFSAVKMHDQRDWDAAIEFATDYYRIICEDLRLHADPTELANAEVNWWEKHDKLEYLEDKKELTDAFALLYSKLFGIAYDDMLPIAQYKTIATHEHDLAEKPEVSSEQAAIHWTNVQQYLVTFYTTLKSKI